MKRTTYLLFLCCVATAIGAQSRYDLTNPKQEQLNRGVIAVKTQDGKVAVSWRTLTSDKKGQAFDLYRNGAKLNKKPLKQGIG